MNYKDILKKAIVECEDKHIYKGKNYEFFNQIYPFTTENISGYIDSFNLKDRSLLTVGSSLDQTYNAVLSGCNDITIIDINPYTKYYYYLKTSCIIELTIDEFILFLKYKDYPKIFKDNKEVFNIDIFNKIKSTLKNLDLSSYLFWNELFSKYQPKKVRDSLFSICEYRYSMLTQFNKYLNNNENYETIKKNIINLNPNFINADILSTKLNNKYDNIWLSNIGTYISNLELKELTDKMINHLNINGSLLIDYIYGTDRKDTKNISNLEQLLKLLNEYNLEILSFVGTDGILFEDNQMTDSALIYRKIK